MDGKASAKIVGFKFTSREFLAWMRKEHLMPEAEEIAHCIAANLREYERHPCPSLAGVIMADLARLRSA
jgi:hypothetical protein